MDLDGLDPGGARRDTDGVVWIASRRCHRPEGLTPPLPERRLFKGAELAGVQTFSTFLEELDGR